VGKAASNAVLDGTLDVIATGTIMTICSAQPTTRAEAVTTYALADVTVSSGDFTKAAGDTSGRKVTVGAKSGVNVDSSGTATHIAICDGSNLLIVTTCTSQALTAGNTANIPAFKYEAAAPT
jgi:hypothetical protein